MLGFWIHTAMSSIYVLVTWTQVLVQQEIEPSLNSHYTTFYKSIECLWFGYLWWVVGPITQVPQDDCTVFIYTSGSEFNFCIRSNLEEETQCMICMLPVPAGFTVKVRHRDLWKWTHYLAETILKLLFSYNKNATMK